MLINSSLRFFCIGPSLSQQVSGRIIPLSEVFECSTDWRRVTGGGHWPPTYLPTWAESPRELEGGKALGMDPSLSRLPSTRNDHAHCSCQYQSMFGEIANVIVNFTQWSFLVLMARCKTLAFCLQENVQTTSSQASKLR